MPNWMSDVIFAAIMNHALWDVGCDSGMTNDLILTHTQLLCIIFAIIDQKYSHSNTLISAVG